MAKSDADRNLLFGLLALQTGMIQQSALLIAFHAWTQDKRRALADILVEQGALDHDGQALIQALAEKHLKMHGGDPERSLASIYSTRAIREGLARLGDSEIEASLRHASDSTEDGDPDCTTSLSVGSATSGGQRFHILRPHARGGLGAVFVALDEELHREVALKQILDHHADDATSRHRFVIEAEITGGLEHPGIVPVYGLGTYADGRPFYAMRFIRGDSLKSAIAAFHADESLKLDPGRRSLELRKLLRRFIDVCNAIEYAHSRGILHRDIKPANVILGKHGETLIVDWGLAKPVGRTESDGPSEERTLIPSSASGSAETLPGSALGTPAYMSPEQAAGALDRLGPRSDVYSLGATLYALLTGHPPFTDEDVGAVLQAVQKGDFPSPRRLEPSLDQALEAICLKAMAPRPDDRYASPRALADDLERWMADEPVTAWREPWEVRAQRWARRNRTAVTAGAVLLIATVLGLSVGAALLGRANSEIQNQRNVARANLQKAQQAVDEYFTQVSENTLLKSPLLGLQPLRHDLLKTALRYYQDFTGQTGADTVSRAELARAYLRMGKITEVVGSKDEAFQHFTRAESIWDSLLKERPGDAAYREELAKALISVAATQSRDLGKPEESLRNLQRAQTLYEGLEREFPQNETYQAGLAGTYQELGHWYYLHKKGADEARNAQRAYDIYTQLSVANPRYRLDAAGAAMNLGFWYTRQRRFEEALRYHEAARTILEAMDREQPGDLAVQAELRRAYTNIGYTYHNSGRYDEALRLYESDIRICEQLARENPRVISYQEQWAGGYKQVAYLLRRMKQYDRAVDSCRRAIAIAGDAMATLGSDSMQLRYTIAESFMIMGENYFEAGRFDQAADAFSQAIPRCAAILGADRDNTDHQYTLGRAHRGYGFLLATMGKPDEAVRSYQSSIAVLEPSGRAPRGDLLALQILAESYERIGALLRKRGRLRDAEESFAAAVKRLGAILLLSSETDEDLIELASVLASLSEAQLTLGKRAEATRSLQAARTRLEAVRPPRAESLVARARVDLLSSRLGETDGSGVPTLDRAMDLLRQAAAMGYRAMDLMRTDPALDPLRDRPDFRLLMMDLSMPDNPFAG